LAETTPRELSQLPCQQNRPLRGSVRIDQFGSALLLSGSAAVAQQAGKPCAGDIKTLCAGIQPGEGRIKGCIKSHLTDLSPTCNDRVLTVAVTGKVCKTDVTNLCGGVVPGTGGIRPLSLRGSLCLEVHPPQTQRRTWLSRALRGRRRKDDP
jgi:hypothetical protein